MSTDYRFIGKPTPRKDALDIVTGKATFIDDIKQPDMLYWKVLRSPYPHADIKTIVTDRAEALPGVWAVLTYKDVPEWKTGMPKHLGVLNRRLRHVAPRRAVGRTGSRLLHTVDAFPGENQAPKRPAHP